MQPRRFVVEGTPSALLIHITEAREASEPLLEALHAASAGTGFAYAALEVSDWNRDLSPWPAPPVFGDESFGGCGRETLDRLLSQALPALRGELALRGVDRSLPACIGGYSLAGLFALWAHGECDAFDAVMAASPSVWFPGWDAWADAHSAPRGPAYLSLGRKEPKTRNRQMAAVGEAIVRQQARFAAAGVPSLLEWNEGNHFSEPEARTAKGFAWILNHLRES